MAIALPGNALADSVVWANRPVFTQELGDVSSPDYLWAPCGGVGQSIKLSGTLGRRSACVFGTETSVRLARFQDDAGVYQYAVAFANSAQYSYLDGFCVSYPGCSYSSASDAVLSQSYFSPTERATTLYTNFTKQLRKRMGASGVSYFVFTPSQKGTPIGMGDQLLAANATTFSDNGKWGLVELVGYGVMRVNVETREVRRVHAPGGTYGTGNNPFYDFTISDNGRYIAVAGYRLGLDIVEVEDRCGDQLVAGQSLRWFSFAIACPYAQLDRFTLFSGFQYAFEPRFSSDGRFLSITVQSNTRKRVVLSPLQLQASTNRKYAALGDSFTSGEGETLDGHYLTETNTKTNRCHVSSRSYPYSIGREWRVAVMNAACSGARSSQIIANSAAGKGQLQRIRDTLPDVISIGIGGNDAGLMDKLKDCLGITTCEWAHNPAKQGPILREIQAIIPKLGDLLSVVRRDVPMSRIVLVGYPQIISDAENAQCGLAKSLLLNTEERHFITETLHYLNQVIESVARANGVQYANIDRAFLGERLCEGDNKAMNSVRFGTDMTLVDTLPNLKVIASESFHPSPIGHQMTASTIIKQYPTYISVSPICFECIGTPVIPNPSNYWTPEGQHEDKTRYRSLEFLEKLVYQPGEKMQITLKRLFGPNSKVRAEIHSTPQLAGVGMASDEGDFQYEIEVPDNLEPGYHSMHLIGNSVDDEPIDIYTTFWLAEIEKGASEASIRKDTRVSTGKVMPRHIQVQSGPVDTGANDYSSKTRPFWYIPVAKLATVLRNSLPIDERTKSSTLFKRALIYSVAMIIISLIILSTVVCTLFLLKRRSQRV